MKQVTFRRRLAEYALLVAAICLFRHYAAAQLGYTLQFLREIFRVPG